ncbi:MAG: hypothetical protein SGJ09_00285 [Phycisphaerae bacterium]|nr:hypothetical protein [Phycisphaerae bacterium]
MPLHVSSTSGVPTATVPAIVKALKLDPTYVGHLAVDETATATFLVVVYRTEASRATRSSKHTVPQPLAHPALAKPVALAAPSPPAVASAPKAVKPRSSTRGRKP